MRTAFFAGLFLCAVLFAADSPRTFAQGVENEHFKLATLDTLNVLKYEAPAEQTPAPEPPKPVEYVVQAGDNLVKIAQVHGETWQRLYSKNTVINDPNIIMPGDKLVIPTKDELLAVRPLPTPAPASVDVDVKPAAKVKAKTATLSQGSSTGNTYYYGYCTWYSKERRPDLPNNLGNAETWVSRAAAQGIPTGSVPRVGAIGQQGNHVVYVERVNDDGTITISDMNFAGRGVITTRTVLASSHTYIY